VLDYFDASLIGLTATPDNRTFGFFKKTSSAEYSHEKSVADGVNVGNDVYLIETEVTSKAASSRPGSRSTTAKSSPAKSAGSAGRRHRLHRHPARPLGGQPGARSAPSSAP
jgi:type I site-specific restriction endonuclease